MRGAASLGPDRAALRRAGPATAAEDGEEGDDGGRQPTHQDGRAAAATRRSALAFTLHGPQALGEGVQIGLVLLLRGMVAGLIVGRDGPARPGFTGLGLTLREQVAAKYRV